MEALPSGGFAAAVLFGALVIWFHAWNQFNRPSYQESSDFTRVLRRLQPSDMRKGPVFLQAYIFYALILTFIYLLICIYASVPFLQGLVRIDIPGLELVGGAAGAQKLPEATRATGASFDDALGSVGATGPSPSLPLLVSLAVVGLAPNVPFLARVEEWIRARSHKLSGIPTHLIDSGLKLRRERLFDPEKGDGLLISDEEWAQGQLYFTAAAYFAGREREALREQVLKTIALRNWVLRGRVFQPDGPTRYRYQNLETEVRQEIRDLLGKLDALAARALAAQQPAKPATAEETAERSLEWQNVVREAEEVCGDTCVLVALYSERDAFAADMKEAKLRAPAPLSAYEQEKDDAAKAFLSALRRVSLVTDRDSFGTTVFFRLAGSIVLTATFAGLFLGHERLANSDQIGSIVLAMKYALTASITYALPLFFALGYQQENLKHDRWENVISGKPSRALAQYVFTFIVAALIALVGLIGNNIYFAIANVGLEVVAERFQALLVAAYGAEVARAVMGGALAVIVALMIDAWRAGKLTGWSSPWPRGLVAGTTLALGLLGAWDRYRSLAAIEGGTIAPSAIALAATSAGLVGLVAATYVLQSLMDEFSEPTRSVPA